MKNITDDRLEKLLADYFESEPPCTLTYRGKSERKTVPVFLLRNKRITAAAASLMLITVLSIIVYFSFGNKADNFIHPAPSPHASTPSEQGREDGTETKNDGTEHVPGDTVNPPDPSVGYFPFGTGLGLPGGNSGPSPTVKPNTPRATQPPGSSEQPKATEQPGKPSPTTRPLEPQAPTEPPVVSPDPTEPPGEELQPIEEPATEPPDPVACTESGDEPALTPTQPEPTINFDHLYQDSIVETVYVGTLEEGDKIYVLLYDEKNNYKRLGDKDAYSDRHLAQVTPLDNGYALIRYTPKDYGILPRRGHYSFRIILKKLDPPSKTILWDNSAYLNN